MSSTAPLLGGRRRPTAAHKARTEGGGVSTQMTADERVAAHSFWHGGRAK